MTVLSLLVMMTSRVNNRRVRKGWIVFDELRFIRMTTRGMTSMLADRDCMPLALKGACGADDRAELGQA